MGERLRWKTDVDAGLELAGFPAMMLQTLVENAVKHGLEPKRAGGSIWLSARPEGNRLSISVVDDGHGLNDLRSGAGIGLANLRERLMLLYGTGAVFSLSENFPTGIRATITLPLQRVEQESKR
jgi:LytS/YehU family sensor histidine kinase